MFTADALHMLWNRDPSMEKLGVLLISWPSPIPPEGALIGEIYCNIETKHLDSTK